MNENKIERHKLFEFSAICTVSYSITGVSMHIAVHFTYVNRRLQH
jgi:hypothetical protein